MESHYENKINEIEKRLEKVENVLFSDLSPINKNSPGNITPKGKRTKAKPVYANANAFLNNTTRICMKNRLKDKTNNF